VNTLRLRLLAHVQTRHDYFADGRCRAMRFEPTPRCREWMSAFELVLRANDHSLTLHLPEHRLQDLWEAVRDAQAPQPPRAPRATVKPVALDFSVHSVDPAFAYYTDAPASQAARISLGDATDHASWLAGLGKSWTLQWHSRHSIWCYWLLGDWEEKVLTIVDTAGTRSFDALGLTPLGKADAGQAHCFRSRAPLPLAERAPTGLQLRAGHSAAATRVVVSQLPAPRPTALQYESGPNGRQAVSEIFVSR
jgi:hypothetical protein